MWLSNIINLLIANIVQKLGFGVFGQDLEIGAAVWKVYDEGEFFQWKGMPLMIRRTTSSTIIVQKKLEEVI